MTPETAGGPPHAAEIACFEAGIKFGSLYHQFAGTPLSVDSAPSLAAAMEAAIENQPHCDSVAVTIDTDAVADAVDEDVGYTELTGRFLDVEMRIEYADVGVRTRREMEGDYPRMKLVAVEE
jgi:hypothetical protein